MKSPEVYVYNLVCALCTVTHRVRAVVYSRWAV